MGLQEGRFRVAPLRHIVDEESELPRVRIFERSQQVLGKETAAILPNLPSWIAEIGILFVRWQVRGVVAPSRLSGKKGATGFPEFPPNS